MKKTILILAVICLLFTPVFLKSKASYESPHETKLQTLYEVELEAWLYKLGTCESHNNWLAIHKDDGGSDSLGERQFKQTTFDQYVKRYNLPYTPQDIWNGDKQKVVAREMIKENYENWRHWYNCTKKIGLPPKP